MLFHMAHTVAAGAVAAVVRDAMDEAGFSVRGMAEQAGFAHVTLTRRLSGQSSFTTAELSAIASVLGTKASALLQMAEQAA